jgi:amidophosphoribosyltransferase
MCGLVGIVAQEPVNQSIFDALTVLQHRGQDAAGMATFHDNRLLLHKGNGLTRDVFRTRHMQRLKGNLGIGHVRYPTAGTNCESEAQPFYVNSPYGITLAHNGNLTNARTLKVELFQDDLRHINTHSDSEIILNIFAHELQQNCRLKAEKADFFQAVKRVHQRCRGAYAVVMMIVGYGLLAFRDPNGIRPLIFGKKVTSKGTNYMVASESVALLAQGYEIIRDVAPGEAVYITQQGEMHCEPCAEHTSLSPCLFELVYFARPDSVIDNISVYKVRMNIGHKLAQKIQRDWPEHDIDVVIPVPETSRSAALSLAHSLNLKFREGFVKNRYIGRTFIMPGQTVRKKSVQQKLNALDFEFQGKNVLIVDDSIVRGTTSQEIIQMARNAGANKVYFASASPPIRHPHIYGIDMPQVTELIAYQRSVTEIQHLIQADKLIYLDLADLVEVAREGNPKVIRFEASVFDGQYITGDEQAYLTDIAQLRGESALN